MFDDALAAASAVAAPPEQQAADAMLVDEVLAQQPSYDRILLPQRTPKRQAEHPPGWSPLGAEVPKGKRGCAYPWQDLDRMKCRLLSGTELW